MLLDHAARVRAIMPNNSFIVQAPAGSGKTEILAQRFLKLLSCVRAPEQVIALTFTRKAANEMRERILLALQKAATKTQPTSSHQQQTYTLATDALTQDQAFDWQILNQPSRLRIMTIDALCQTLTQSIPLVEQHIPFAKVSDSAATHYQSAARACLKHALEETIYHPSLTTLLTHLDNRQDQLLSLFSELLINRDQWLGPLFKAKQQDKATYEEALKFIEQHELLRFRNSIPRQEANDLYNLVIQLANIPDSPHVELSRWTSFAHLTSEVAACLAKLLLTSQNTLRKSFDHHVGLKKGVCSLQQYQQLKTDSKELLAHLSTWPEFTEALLRVRHLPSPQYEERQWQVLQAIFTLLPLLVAHLQLIFSQQNQVDFQTIAAQALLALGDEDAPTDLALHLDHQVQHLLVDEFQDTSLQQFQLLTQLVQGWQPDDGRTLFVVGDPMQSIYRFRAAEVGLFLRARSHGIGPVNLENLTLSCNFRSTPLIVNWINTQFKSIFPIIDDMEFGAIAFHASSPMITSQDCSEIIASQYADALLEANAIAARVQDILHNYPQDTVAILVRSRNQLSPLIQILREQNIAFQGVDIDLLATLPHLRDVWSLTQALLMPAHRLAWLALLRSPWCGLNLKDLHCIAQFDKRQSIYQTLEQLEQIQELSEDGKLRTKFIYNILHNALSNRYQLRLVDWIINTLNQLYLDNILTLAQQTDLEQYWLLLDKHEQAGQIIDLEIFKIEFNKLYSQQVVPSKLQIMTIHKSKGLEFDSVILSGLSAAPARQKTPLLRWLTLPTQAQKELLLLSPIKATDSEPNLLYDYIGKLETEKSHYELQRLLYVATTRAKKRLYLFDHQDKGKNGSFRDLLKNTPFIANEINETDQLQPSQLSNLVHLPIDFYTTTKTKEEHIDIQRVNEDSIFLKNLINQDDLPRLIGIAVHTLLCFIGTTHPKNLHDIPWQFAFHKLNSAGLKPTDIQQAEQEIKQHITRFWHCSIGQWIMQPRADEKNEYALLTNLNGEVVTRIIDRTFSENNERWIIDFKTGIDDPNTDLQHREQIAQYASLLKNNPKYTIHGGLYYLAQNHWVNWIL